MVEELHSYIQTDVENLDSLDARGTDTVLNTKLFGRKVRHLKQYLSQWQHSGNTGPFMCFLKQWRKMS